MFRDHVLLFGVSLLGFLLPMATSGGLWASSMTCLGFGKAMFCGRHGDGITGQVMFRMGIV
jgi:hypothetical protein